MVKSVKTTEPANHIAVFQETSIRRVWHKEEWWFFVVDVCAILTASPDAGAYGRKLKQRETDCSNTEDLFRIIQSIPSPKAEPFKCWLAQVGCERVKEIENPEPASARDPAPCAGNWNMYWG